MRLLLTIKRLMKFSTALLIMFFVTSSQIVWTLEGDFRLIKRLRLRSVFQVLLRHMSQT